MNKEAISDKLKLQAAIERKARENAATSTGNRNFYPKGIKPKSTPNVNEARKLEGGVGFEFTRPQARLATDIRTDELITNNFFSRNPDFRHSNKSNTLRNHVKRIKMKSGIKKGLITAGVLGAGYGAKKLYDNFKKPVQSESRNDSWLLRDRKQTFGKDKAPGIKMHTKTASISDVFRQELTGIHGKYNQLEKTASNLVNALEVGGLGILAKPSLGTAFNNKASDAEKSHARYELAGLGVLGAHPAYELAKNRSDITGSVLGNTAGLVTKAEPYVNRLKGTLGKLRPMAKVI